MREKYFVQFWRLKNKTPYKEKQDIQFLFNSKKEAEEVINRVAAKGWQPILQGYLIRRKK